MTPTRRPSSMVSSRQGTSRPAIGTSCALGVTTGKNGRVPGSDCASSLRQFSRRRAARGPSSRNSAHWPSSQLPAAACSGRPRSMASARTSVAISFRVVQSEGAPGQHGLDDSGHHHLVRLPDQPHDRHRLRAQRPMTIAAPLAAVQSGEADQGGRARSGRFRSHRQRPLHPARSLDRVTAEEPESPQAGGEPERGLGIVRDRPAQRGPQVVVLAVDQLRLFDDHPGGPLGVVGDGEVQEVRAMRGLQQQSFTRLVEVLGAELPDRLQLPVPGSLGCPFRDHQRLVDQFGQQVQEFAFGGVAGLRRPPPPR